ncbi:MAG: hypothetical protein MZV70_14960 [Desulfobacterales bacterium]|nr:hypothetical protein [Desulfobacterales bacterium]
MVSQLLGRVYMKGMSALSNGVVTVYAHKTPYVPTLPGEYIHVKTRVYDYKSGFFYL